MRTLNGLRKHGCVLGTPHMQVQASLCPLPPASQLAAAATQRFLHAETDRHGLSNVGLALPDASSTQVRSSVRIAEPDHDHLTALCGQHGAHTRAFRTVDRTAQSNPLLASLIHAQQHPCTGEQDFALPARPLELGHHHPHFHHFSTVSSAPSGDVTWMWK